ncbi:MAG: enoyl-CoA hydratase/isomerase family protein, partial [Frankia sp.]|nr:enoyl-CoA hydratase/isomerase family protein [Frankia sp.]
SASPDELGATFRAFYRVLARLLRFPGATVAAVNGHAFGAGAILATAADYRVQRADRGYFCLPEIDLGVPLSPEFEAVLRAKLPPAALLDALLTGRRYGGPDAQAAGFVHATAAEDKLLDTAVDLVRGLVAKSSRATAALRSGLYRDVLAVLDPGND